MESKDSRTAQLISWLKDDCALTFQQLQALAGDASMRRYFRVLNDQQSYVVMDAPPAFENCANFIAVSRALSSIGLNTPQIIHQNIAAGFLLLDDFGDATYLKILNASNADQLYGKAIEALIKIQGCKNIPGRETPIFSQEFMQREWGWHKEWFLSRFLLLPISRVEHELDAAFHLLSAEISQQPYLFMHRDYHSANLMYLANREVGILDFQDAFFGPVTYDLVSLLRDCYIAWPEKKVLRWVKRYYDYLNQNKMVQPISEDCFVRWFDWMGLQRHLKALFTFSRKKLRDNQKQYLKYMPRTLDYIITVSARYPELYGLHVFYESSVAPALKEHTSLCML